MVILYCIISDIDCIASQLVQKGLRFNTHRTYRSAQRFYANFCHTYGLTSLPASEQQMLRFIAYAHSKHLAPSTINVYLAAVASLHQLNGFCQPQLNAYKLKLALKAVADIGPSAKSRAPITYQLLCYLCDNIPIGPNSALDKALLAFGFYGAFRGSEYTAVSQAGRIIAPKLSQVQFIQVGSQMALNYTIYRTKTTYKPVEIQLGCSLTSVCAVCLLLQYLYNRQHSIGLHPDSYLFADTSG